MFLVALPRSYCTLVIACVAALCAGVAAAQPFGYSVQSDGDDHLYRISLFTGTAADIGPTGLSDVEGLAFQPGTGVLFGWDEGRSRLVTLNTSTGSATLLGPSGITAGNAGLAFDSSGRLFLSSSLGATRELYAVNPATGAANLIGLTDPYDVLGLEDAGGNFLWGLAQASDNATLNFVMLRKADATTVLVGDTGLGTGISSGAGLDFDNGRLWGLADSGEIFLVNATNGMANVVANTLSGFEGLAIRQVPEPATLLLVTQFAWLLPRRRRRR